MSEQGTSCSMVPLAKAMSMDVSTLTRNMAVLERNGLVHSVPGQDRRVRQVFLTEKGHMKLVQVYPSWLKAQQTVQELLGTESLDELLVLLRQVRKVRKMK